MATRSLSARAGRILAYAVVSVWSLLPVLFIVSASFKRQTDIFTYPPTFVFTPTFDATIHPTGSIR